MSNVVKMGMTVKDRITGFQGVVNHEVEYAYQGLMFGVAPTGLDKDGEVRDAKIFDGTQLEIIDEKPLFAFPEPQPCLFKFGDEVRDTITGYEGKVAGIARYINGCTRVLIRPPYDKTKENARMKDGEFIPEGAVELVKKVKAEKEIAPTRRGGPADFDSSLV